MARWEAMKSERRMYEPFYQASACYFDPMRAKFWSGEDRTTMEGPQFNELMSGVGITSLNRMTNFLLGNGMPQASQWFELGNGDPAEQSTDSLQWWYDASRTLSREMNRSFYMAMRGSLKTMGYSFGAVYVGEMSEAGKPTGEVYYEACPSHACWYQFDPFSRVKTFAYNRAMTTEDVYTVLGKRIREGQNLEERSKRSSERLNILQIVLRNEKAKVNPRSFEDYAFKEYWIDVAEKKIIARSGFRSQPFHVIPWHRDAGENYSVGPCYDALPEMRGANISRRNQLQAMQWAGKPPLLGASRDALDNPKKAIVPGRMVFGAINSKGAPLIQPLANVTNPAIFQYSTADDEARVRSLMMNDELINANRPEMTATEARIVSQERAALVAPFMLSVMPAIHGMLERHLEIRLRVGGLPDVPREIAEGDLPVSEFMGPIALAARQANIQSLFQTVEQLGMLGEIDPMAVRSIDMEEATKAIYEANGRSALMRDLGAVQDEMKQAASVEQGAAEAQLAQLQAGAAKTGAEAVTELAGAI